MVNAISANLADRGRRLTARSIARTISEPSAPRYQRTPRHFHFHVPHPTPPPLCTTSRPHYPSACHMDSNDAARRRAAHPGWCTAWKRSGKESHLIWSYPCCQIHLRPISVCRHPHPAPNIPGIPNDPSPISGHSTSFYVSRSQPPEPAPKSLRNPIPLPQPKLESSLRPPRLRVCPCPSLR